MLTADLVTARRAAGELRLVKLEGARRAKGEELATAFLALARDHVGRTREELESAWEDASASAGLGASGARLGGALRKLVEDGCRFDAEPDVDPAHLRRDVFLRAAAARRALDDGATFARERVLEEVGEARGMAASEIERLLYADLRGAAVLREAPAFDAGELVRAFDLAQAQAVLLRAVRVTCEVRCASALALRAFFRKLKFLRLLHTLAPLADGGYRVVIDGPFNLFEASTRYGLKLAMLLPALSAVDTWSLVADLRWGKARESLTFKLEGHGEGRGDAEVVDEVRALMEAIEAAPTAWKVTAASSVLDVPGGGVIVPDLVFARPGARDVYLEALGYWSRDAVWRRVELAEKGLSHRVLFAASARLRVSEEVLPEEGPAQLYVYKGVMSARAVLERVERLGRAGS